MKSIALSRRCFLGASFGLLLPALKSEARAEIFKDTSGLSAGNFVWQPRLSTSGPVLVLLSPLEQTVHVYRGLERIGISTCRIGRDGAPLPFGVLSLIDQGRQSRGDASGRRAWRAAASFTEGLQRGRAGLPIRIPKDFAGLLAGATENGASIIIAPRRTVPAVVSHALGAPADDVSAIGTRAGRGPETADAMGEEAHVVFSGASRTATLLRGGKVIATAAIAVAEPQRPLGTHFYALQGRSADGAMLTWLAVSLAQRTGPAQLSDAAAQAALDRITFADKAGAAEIRGALGTRAGLIVTDAAAGAETRLAAPGLELFSDGEASVQPAAVSSERAGRKGRFARKAGARTAESAEPREATPSFLNPLY